jgi:hypothetical protein
MAFPSISFKPAIVVSRLITASRNWDCCRATLSCSAAFSTSSSAQPANIGAIGSADEMGEHMHFAKDLTSQILRRVRVCQHRPVAAGNLGPLHGIRPKGAHTLDISGLAELADRGPVTPIQGLLQQF